MTNDVDTTLTKANNQTHRGLAPELISIEARRKQLETETTEAELDQAKFDLVLGDGAVRGAGGGPELRPRLLVEAVHPNWRWLARLPTNPRGEVC